MTKKIKLTKWTKVQADDISAFDEVYADHIDSLYNYGTSLTSDVHLLEDSIQEVFINIWTKRKSISINSNIKNYLFTALRRQIVDQIQKQKKINFKEEIVEKSLYERPKVKVEDSRLVKVKKEIAKLSKREREALVLKYQEGLSYEAISNLMNLNNQALYKLISRGVKKIKSNLGKGMMFLL